MAKKRRARQGRDYWTRVIAKFERRGLSQGAFCEREKLNIGTFRTWLYRLRGEGAIEAPSFVEVEDRPRPPARTCVVRLGAAQVEFAQTPEAGYLVELLAALDSHAR